MSSRAKKILAGCVAVAIVLMVILVFTLRAISADTEHSTMDQVDTRQAELAFENCRQDNWGRANKLLDSVQAEDSAAEFPRQINAEPIVVCARVLQGNDTIPLLKGQTIKYLRIFKGGKAPIIDENGQVIGSEDFPLAPDLSQSDVP